MKNGSFINSACRTIFACQISITTKRQQISFMWKYNLSGETMVYIWFEINLWKSPFSLTHNEKLLQHHYFLMYAWEYPPNTMFFCAISIILDWFRPLLPQKINILRNILWRVWLICFKTFITKLRFSDTINFLKLNYDVKRGKKSFFFIKSILPLRDGKLFLLKKLNFLPLG